MCIRDRRSSIVLQDVEKTAKTISGTRLDDLKKEYISIIPSLPVAVSMFEHGSPETVSYTHLRAHETVLDLVCRLLLEKKTQQS